MMVTFKCAKCDSPVGYDLVSLETHELRQYGVERYVCVQPCQTCAAPEPSCEAFTFETAGVA
jgi:hypothetical protein